jgi:3-mercaptopyruvate sulfurtransferase SseA
VDSETREAVQVDPEEIRAAYTAKMTAEIDSLAREADLRQIQHQLVDTRSPYTHAIETYLGFRGRNQANR